MLTARPSSGLRFQPADVVRLWPNDQPLLMLHSGRMHPRWARWTIAATPRAWYRFDTRSHLEGDLPQTLRGIRFVNDPLRDLDALLAATSKPTATEQPFTTGWIGYLSYELGHLIEPTSAPIERQRKSMAWPLVELAYCDASIVFDHINNRWHPHNDPELLRELVRAAPPAQPQASDVAHVGCVEGNMDAARYGRKVQRIIDYIAAGDIYQANLTQRLSASFTGSSRLLADAAFASAQPWHGGYLELPEGRSLVSLSPELFLDMDQRSRRVITRPIKGTRPADVHPQQLIDSAKDAAELHMIVDLMRNDLGRVCEFGSVQVPQPRLIETHPTVHHGVAEITGTLRSDVSIGDLLRATFPCGSITGAPKIRAMQIINELEDEARGPYCGAIGFFSDSGRVSLNVAIRTIMLRGDRCGSTHVYRDGELAYGTGGGIVAESDPAAEYRECMDKAAVLVTALQDMETRRSE